MKNNNLESSYQCVGENFKNNFRMGSCGDIKSLKDWMIFLLGDKSIDYFEGFPVKEIVDYIYKNAGKRLSKLN